MEVYRTKDNQVAKYVHDDGSETAIKTIGCGPTLDNKFNVFISTSVGCPVGCKFCYLTAKKCPYIRLSKLQILNNVIQALDSELETRPELEDKYIKISWMGSGDAFVDFDLVHDTTKAMIKVLPMIFGLPGIDSVDIATTMPKVPEDLDTKLISLQSLLYSTTLNPERNYFSSTRTPLRIFYSLQQTDPACRKKLIPNTVPLYQAAEVLSEKLGGANLIFHHMFLEGVNDSLDSFADLVWFMKNFFHDNELRLLRFNKCPMITDLNESPEFDSIVRALHHTGINLKVQESPGAEIFAACGQFLLAKFK